VYKSALVILCACTIGIIGCSAGSELSTSAKVPESRPDLVATDPTYRAAMDHFMSGNLNDIKGEYAPAILDYQEALRYYQDPAIHDAMAQDYIRLGKPNMAIEESKQAVALSPEEINYLRTLAQAYLSGFDVDSARIQYQKILSIDSTQVQDILVLAQLDVRDNPKEAARLYERALSLVGPDLPTMMQLVKIYNSTGQFDKSIDVVNNMLRVDPSNVALKEMLADLYLQVDKSADALKLLKELMAERKGDYNLQARAATAYLRMRDFASADSLLDAIFSSDSTRADAKFAIAQFYLNEMQRDSSVVPFAEQIFSRLLALYPNDARAYLMAGLGASYADEDSVAEIYLNKSVAIDSTNPNSWQALGLFYYQKKSYGRMVEVMSKAARLFPDEYRVNLFLGLALNQAGKNGEAVRPLEKAVSLKPTDTDALSTLGQVYEALHRYDDAYRIYETALKVDAKNSLILNNYAYSLSERGVDLDKALKMAKLAVDLDPNNSAYLDTMGWVYFKLGEYKEAESFVKKALAARQKSDGSSATLEEHLGDIYEKLGDNDRAIEQWKKALEENPDNAGLKAKIEKAKT
jgi:tetratricopeptide (TPR) repeat protein